MIVHLKKFILPFRKLDKFGKIQKQFVRHDSSQSSQKILEHLKNKSLIQVRGKEASNFLQGLITNDMKHYEEGAANLYALFLNIKGRVMYDVIIYKTQEDDVYYIECDSQAVEPLKKHLKMYRVRKKIDIDSLGDTINVWTFFDPMHYLDNKVNDTNRQKLEGLIFPCGSLNNKVSKVIDNIMIYEDPRLPNLGMRILAETKIERNEIAKYLNSDTMAPTNSLNFKAFRYKLGIAEGIEDLPPGKPLPLEVNCDYLHGVSFHKGCYVGQELTARTYHTGVVRKRLMPLLFNEVPNKSFAYDEKIINESGNVVGKFRGIENEYGLGLIRITEALKAQSLTISDIELKVSKPVWWPQETQAQSASFTKK
ncbi:putative transferase CAF17 homolog, mitochondrial [Osmia bicornis bicornis]|uniref:putative transferase CAF17 homolog, mitochondrial n=1 Tax=Osmia bicornis bicornis TaxID=1437191 RepID=UPI001EAEAA47|nr:putative transferase CAF17 homolog, mitochondrial [Osmia bicornis bicornis]